MNKPRTLQEAIRYFSDEQTCIDAIAAIRWPNGGERALLASHKEHYYLKAQKRWKCKECHRQFSVKLGTIFEDSAIKAGQVANRAVDARKLPQWLFSYEVSALLGITQKFAWFVLHRLRLALQSGNIGKLGGQGGAVEADEAFIGGLPKNMHPERR